MAEEKEYEVLEEGNEIVASIRQRYPREFCNVVPEQVVVLVITNFPRPFSMKKLAQITKVNPAHRTIIKRYGRKDVRYIIEVYLSDWSQWNPPRKQWIMAHELGHIGSKNRKSLVQHDCQDFNWLLDAVGIMYWSKDNLPDILTGQPFPFKTELFNIPEEDDQDGDEQT